MLCSAVFALLMFGVIGQVQAQEAAKRVHRPRVAEVRVTTTDMIAHDPFVSVSEWSGRRWRRFVDEESSSKPITASDPLIIRVRVGRYYEIVVADAEVGFRTWTRRRRMEPEGVTIELPVRVTDSRDQQILDLRQQVSSLNQQVASQYNEDQKLRSIEDRVFANATLRSPVYVRGAVQAKLGSFTVQPGEIEGLTLSRLVARKNFAPGLKVQNLSMRVEGSAFAQTKPTVGDEETVSYNQSNPKIAPSLEPCEVGVYGDILETTTPGTYTAAISLVDWTALGTIRGSAVPFPGEARGQTIRVVDGPVLQVSDGANTPPAKIAVMGSTDVRVLTFRTFASFDDVATPELVVDVAIENGEFGKSGWAGFRFKDGATVLSGPSAVAMTMQSATQATITFQLSSPAITAKNGSKEFSVEGDVATFQSGSAISGATYTFSVRAAGITARSVSSPSATVTVVGSGQGYPVTLARTKLTLTTNQIGPTTGRGRQTADDLAAVHYTADPAHQVGLLKTRFKAQGGAIPNGSTSFTFDQVDPGTGTTFAGTATQTCTPGPGNSCYVTFTFSPAFIISAGTTISPRARVNSSVFSADALAVFIESTDDVEWTDGEGVFHLLPQEVPVPIFTGSYD